MNQSNSNISLSDFIKELETSKENDAAQLESGEDFVPSTKGRGFNIEVKILRDTIDYLKEDNVSKEQRLREIEEHHREEIQGYQIALGKLTATVDRLQTMSEDKLDGLLDFIVMTSTNYMVEVGAIGEYIKNVEAEFLKLGIDITKSIDGIVEHTDANFIEAKEYSKRLLDNRVHTIRLNISSATDRILQIKGIVTESNAILKRLDPQGKRTSGYREEFDRNSPDFDPAVLRLVGQKY